jgi:hypothetical protein
MPYWLPDLCTRRRISGLPVRPQFKRTVSRRSCTRSNLDNTDNAQDGIEDSLVESPGADVVTLERISMRSVGVHEWVR